jgi:hypothetical protein
VGFAADREAVDQAFDDAWNSQPRTSPWGIARRKTLLWRLRALFHLDTHAGRTIQQSLEVKAGELIISVSPNMEHSRADELMGRLAKKPPEVRSKKKKSHSKS